MPYQNQVISSGVQASDESNSQNQAFLNAPSDPNAKEGDVSVYMKDNEVPMRRI